MQPKRCTRLVTMGRTLAGSFDERGHKLRDGVFRFVRYHSGLLPVVKQNLAHAQARLVGFDGNKLTNALQQISCFFGVTLPGNFPA